MSVSCKVGSLGCSDRRSISRDSVHEDRNPGKRAGIAASNVTAVRSFAILSIIAIKSWVVLAVVIVTTTVLSIIIMSTVISSIWSSSGNSCCGTVSGEVGSFSCSDLRGVVDWQGCRVGYSGGVRVAEAKISWSSMH
jgi:hypothetical protein